MIEKIGTVKNPLTIVAIFASIVEIMGTISLPLISADNQFTFIVFLIVFPSSLLCLFFATLNFNRDALYAPSDFQDEDNYMKGRKKATPKEIEQKQNSEVAEFKVSIADPSPIVATAASEGVAQQKEQDSPDNALEEFQETRKIHRNLSEKIRQIEKAALYYLSSKFGDRFRAQIRFGKSGDLTIADGVVAQPGLFNVYEIKYMETYRGTLISNALGTGMKIYRHSPALKENFRMTIMIVSTQASEIASHLESMQIIAEPYPFPVDFEFFSTDFLLDFAATGSD